MKILVAEGDDLVAMFIIDSLSEAGHEVCGPVQTAGAALIVARAVKPDLVLSNIDLADGTKGTELARMLRAESNIPVLFVTGNFDEAQAAREAALGFISKPCSPTLLQESVKVAHALALGARSEELHIPPGLTLFQKT